MEGCPFAGQRLDPHHFVLARLGIDLKGQVLLPIRQPDETRQIAGKIHPLDGIEQGFQGELLCTLVGRTAFRCHTRHRRGQSRRYQKGRAKERQPGCRPSKICHACVLQ